MMKKLTAYFFLAPLLAIVLFSCGGKTKKSMLVNSWRITKFTDSIPQEKQDEMLKNAIISFDEEGTFSLTGMGGYQHGNYTLSSDAKKLTLTDAGGAVHENEVITLTKNSLVILDIASGSILTTRTDGE